MTASETIPSPEVQKQEAVHGSVSMSEYCALVGLDFEVFQLLGGSCGVWVGLITLDSLTCAAMEEVSAQFGGNNRKIRKQAVAQYTDSINRAQFDFTGQTIIISDKGTILDGHHRIRAGKAATASFPVLLVFGIGDHSFDIIDNSVGRTMADNMELSGAGRYAWLGTAINMLITLERTGNPLTVLPTTITPRERHKYAVAHKDELEWARNATLAIADSKVPIAMPETAYVLYTAYRSDPVKAQAFVDQLISGAGLELTDPRLTLRSWLVDAEERRRKKQNGRKNKNAQLLALMKAVKAFYAGEALPKIVIGKNEAVIPTV